MSTTNLRMGRWGVALGEAHARLHEAFDVGCLVVIAFGLGVLGIHQRGGADPTLVVGEDQDEVGRAGRGLGNDRRSQRHQRSGHAEDEGEVVAAGQLIRFHNSIPFVDEAFIGRMAKTHNLVFLSYSQQ